MESNRISQIQENSEAKIVKLQEVINNKDVDFNKFHKSIIWENDRVGLALRYRDILKPTECNTQLNKAIEDQKEKMNLFKKKIESLKLEKAELQKINFNLSSEILKMKAVLSTSTGYHNYMKQNKELIPNNLKVNFDEQIQKIINFHQKYIKSDKEDIIYGESEINDLDYISEAEEYNSDYSGEMTEKKPEIDKKISFEKKKDSKKKFDIPKLGGNGAGGLGIGLGLGDISKGNVENIDNDNREKKAEPQKMALDLTKAKQIQEDVAKKVMEKYYPMFL